MSRKKENLTREWALEHTRSFIILNSGTSDETVIPFSEATSEMKQRLAENAGKAVSDYLNVRPDEARAYLEDYYERKRLALENLENAVSALDKHLNTT